MRGTPHDVFVGECHIGIIPAYAGNTFRPVMVGVRPRDHPRVCGEHALLANANAEPLGSSPRMRGTQSSSAKSDYRRGIIPAYAGNTNSFFARIEYARDHPRVCGEHRKDCRISGRFKGSSPRMRGTPTPSRCHGTKTGIIPAYAGNTFAKYGLAFCTAGSSPRMRGTPEREHSETRIHGIIPAYAGNTYPRSDCVTPTRDHPRVCGEHRMA